MDNIFIQLAIILGLASSLGYITYKFKLPILVAYLVGGLILASVAVFDIKTSEALSFLPEIGIAFVLFLIGMELDLREIKSLGVPIVLAGLLQLIITSLAGFIFSQTFGFSTAESVYLGIGLSFSSTVVVIKLLLEKKSLTSLYGKLSIGILLLEDLLAVLILLGLTVSPSIFNLGLQQVLPILTFILKVCLLFAAGLILNRFVLPAIFRAVSASSELLFLTALSFLFIYVSFAITLGFSVVIGAFLAGVALASSPYHYHIQGRVKPLRDFFVALFFVYLGTQAKFNDLGAVYPLVIIFTFYSLAIKPLIFLLVLGGFGFRKHTMFQTAVNLSQISEFSLIIMLIGVQSGVVSSGALTVITLSLIISTIFSSIMVAHSNIIYRFIKKFVSLFEKKNFQHDLETQTADTLEGHVVVIGAHKVGGEIVRFLKREKKSLVVLDFNPTQVEALLASGIQVIYGDMADPEVLDILSLEKAKIIISTAPDPEDNKTLLEDLRLRKISVPTIARAETVKQAKDLYRLGADFVIIPDLLAGDFLLNILRDHLEGSSFFKDRPRIELDKLSHKTLSRE